MAIIKPNLNRLFEKSLSNLSEEHNIKVVYSCQTLCGLIKSVMKKKSLSAAGGVGKDFA